MNEIQSNPATAPMNPALPGNASDARASWSRGVAMVIGVIAAIGIFLRLRHFLAGRSLWCDEAALAMNIVHRSFSGLMQPLDFEQGAPLGYLFFNKLCFLAFGPHEQTFRILSILTGVLSVLLAIRVARYVGSPVVAVVFVALVSLSRPFIYYAGEGKQYSTDACALLLISATAFDFFNARTNGSWWRFALASWMAIWFSHPSVFVIAATCLTLVAASFKLDSTARGLIIRRTIIVGVCAAAIFGTEYLVFLRNLSNDRFLAYWWRDGFMPRNVAAAGPWFFRQFAAGFSDPGGLYEPEWFKTTIAATVFGWVPACIYFLGAISAWAKGRRLACGFVIAPVACVLAASVLQRYPYFIRLILVIVPSLYLGISLGFVAIWEQLRRIHLAVAVAGVAVLGSAVLVYPVARALECAVHPPEFQELSPLMIDAKKNIQRGDVLYIYCGARWAYNYYSEQLQFDQIKDVNVIFGNSFKFKKEEFESELLSLRKYRRVWIIASQIYPRPWGPDDVTMFTTLDKVGKRTEDHRATGAYVVLYEFAADAN